MVFSSFIKSETYNQIILKNVEPIVNIGSIRFYQDDSNGFSKKEFRWSGDNNYWSAWASLSQTNITAIPSANKPLFYLEIRYVGTGSVNFFSLTSDNVTINFTNETTSSTTTSLTPQNIEIINSIITKNNEQDSSINKLFNKNSQIDGSINYLYSNNSSNVDSSLNELYIKDDQIDGSLNYIYQNLGLSQDSSLNQLYIKDDQIDGSLNYLYNNMGSSQDGSLNQLYLKDSQIDGSLNKLFIKDVSIDVSINYLISKTIQQDGSLNTLFNKDSQTDGSINKLFIRDNVIDGSINKLFTKDSQIDGSLGTLYTKDLLIDGSINKLFVKDLQIDNSINNIYLNYQISGNYLTTAAQSNHTHSQYINTSNQSLFRLTSNDSQLQYTSANTNFLASNATSLFRYTSNDSQLVYTSVSSNLQHISGTSAITSNAFPSSQTTKFAGTGTSATNASVTLNSNGLAINLPNYITTAMVSNAASNFVGLNSAVTNITATINSSGISISNPGWLTTAMQSNATSLFRYTSNDSQIQFTSAMSNYQSLGNYLTTAMQSNAGSNFAGIGASATNASITLNSNGLAISVAAPNAGGDGYNIIAAAGSTANTSGTIVFSNSNGVSFGLNNATITASHNGLTTAMQSNATSLFRYTSNDSQLQYTSVMSNYQSTGNYLTTAMVSNAASNFVGLNSAVTNITATINSSGISISNPGWLTTAMASNASSAFLLTSQSSLFQHTSGTSAITSNAFPSANTTKFAGTGTSATNASVTLNSNGLAISIAAPAMQGSGTYTQNTGTIQFANSNNVTFGLSNNGVMTASIPNYLTTAAASNHSHGNPTLALTNLTGTTASASNGLTISLSAESKGSLYFNDANNVTFGASINGISTTITASVSGLGGGDGVNIIAASGSTAATSGTIIFSNSNGISFGLNGATMTASHNGLTTAMASNATSLFRYTSNDSQLQYTSANTNFATYNHTHGNPTLALTNLTGTTASASNGLTISLSAESKGSLYFNDANNVTFGASVDGVSTTITASINGGGAGGAAIQGSGTYSQNTGTVQFSNANNVTFGLSNNGVMTASIPNIALQTHTHGAISGYNITATSASNGLTLSVAAPGAAAENNWMNVSGNTSGNTTVSGSTINWVAGNNITISGTNGSQLRIDGAQGSLYFSNANNITFGTSVNGISTTLSASVNAGAGGGAAIQGSGTYSQNTGTIQFVNSNNISFGLSNNGVMTASVAAPGAAAENNWMNVSGNTSGNTTVSGSTINWVAGNNITISGTNGSQLRIDGAQGSLYFSNANNVSFGTSINGISTTLSASIPNYIANIPLFQHPENAFSSLGAIGQGSLSIKLMQVPFSLSATGVTIGGSLSAATNTSATTASANMSLWIGIYTLNGSSLSLASSGSANNGFQWSQSASTTANTSINSMRQMTVPMDINMTPGMYWMAAVISSATTYTNAAFTMYGAAIIANAKAEIGFAPIGSGTTASQMAIPFQGIYKTATAAGPLSISKDNINFTSASNVLRANFYCKMASVNY